MCSLGSFVDEVRLVQVNVRDVVTDDADALGNILVNANELAFRGCVPAQCLTFTVAESAANWRRSLTAGFRAGEFIYVVEVDGERAGMRWRGRSQTIRFFAVSCGRSACCPRTNAAALARCS
jgi:hypothetical protein